MRVNPCGFAYSSMSGCPPYARPGGLLVAGRGTTHWTNPEWQQYREKGCKVFAYIDVVERPDTRVSAADNAFYMGDQSKVPLWPYPTPGVRSNWKDTKLTDIRAGGSWSNYAMAYMEEMMASKRVDGVFLDVLGALLWGGLANWKAWPQKEKDEWTRGCVDFVRRLSIARDRLNPTFAIVNNNVWERGDAVGLEGEKYVDGICLEGHASTSAYHVAYIQREFSGKNRCTIVIADDAVKWAERNGVTHVTDQKSYGTPTPPPIPFTGPSPEPAPDEAELRRMLAETTAALSRARQELEDAQRDVSELREQRRHAVELLNNLSSYLG